MYEYKVVSQESDRLQLEEQLNELATQGWRVVAGAGAGSGEYSPVTLILVLERKKSP